jgi:hypothetical protein
VALADLQRALATLYTDEASRERFRRDPRAFANRFGLSDAEFGQIRAIGEARIHAYADTLDRKRAAEAARLLPLSARLRGPEFRAAFLAHARVTRLGTGPGRYRDDALAFARRPPVHPLTAFEAAQLRGGAWLALVGCDLPATLASLGDAPPRVVPGLTLVARPPFASRALLLRLRGPG